MTDAIEGRNDARDRVRGRRSAQLFEVKARAGAARLRLRARVTPAGLLAIAGLVSSTLLSASALVWVSTSVARQHPLATGLRSR